jgi:hypothetical protein
MAPHPQPHPQPSHDGIVIDFMDIDIHNSGMLGKIKGALRLGLLPGGQPPVPALLGPSYGNIISHCVKYKLILLYLITQTIGF